MAYFLSFQRQAPPNGNFVTFPPALLGASSFHLRLDLTNRISDSSFKAVFSNRQSGSNRQALYFYGTNNRAGVSVVIGGVRHVIDTPAGSIPVNQRFIFEAIYNGTSLEILIDGVASGSVSASGLVGGVVGIDCLGRVASEPSAAMDIYGLEIWESGVLTRNYDPSASNGTGTTLIDTVGGNNGTLVNFPTDNSQWLFYDDGAGSTEQITSSGGIASALAGGAASAQIINEQVLSASGIASAVAAGIASNAIVNEQVNSYGGIASAIASASASTSVINEQVLSTGGIAAAIAGATASTQVINEQTSDQIVISGGISASIGSAAASTQVVHEQTVSSGGAVASLAGGVGVTTVVDQYAVVQVVQSGGISSAYMSSINTTSQVVDQIVSSGGVAAAVMTGSASTTAREFSGNWGEPTILFSEPLPIQQISLTFDQLGRPLVFYRVGENTLKLYWYDPILQQNVLTTFAEGVDPLASFDFPQDTGQSFTDVLLFYVRDDRIYMRVQRDRYAIEYPVSDVIPRVRLRSAGLRIDNRFQVEYIYPEVT